MNMPPWKWWVWFLIGFATSWIGFGGLDRLRGDNGDS